MNDEKLIELVRNYASLSDLSNPKYMDTVQEYYLDSVQEYYLE